MGERSFEIVAVDPRSTNSFLFEKVRSINYQGKPYFDLWNVYAGLGFASVSKLTDGLSMHDGKKK